MNGGNAMDDSVFETFSPSRNQHKIMGSQSPRMKIRPPLYPPIHATYIASTPRKKFKRNQPDLAGSLDQVMG
jgi:hypothetical protein